MKIQRVWHSCLPDKDFLKNLEIASRPWDDLQLKNNGSSWMGALAGAERSKIGSALKGSRVASFIERRIAEEKSFLDWIKQETSRQTNKRLQAGVCIRQAQEFLNDNTFIDLEVIKLMADIDHTAKNPGSAEWQRGKSMLRVLNHQLRIDFYYSLLCELGLDVAEYLAANGVYDENRDQLLTWGFAGDIAPGFSSQESRKDRPLIRLFEVLRQRLSELAGEEVTVRKMASYLPLPADCTVDEFLSYSSESPGDHKYRRFKKWRKGEIPDQSALELFIARLCEGHDSEHYLAWMKAQVALAWGRLIDEEEEALAPIFNAHPDLQCFNAIGSYSKYWNRYKNQAADISAA